MAVGDWWFRFADARGAHPPTAWGEEHRFQRVRDATAKPLLGIDLATGERASVHLGWRSSERTRPAPDRGLQCCKRPIPILRRMVVP
jgi:hypothetical protein